LQVRFLPGLPRPWDTALESSVHSADGPYESPPTVLALIIFNAVVVVLSASVAFRLIPADMVRGALHGLHITVGVTTPPRDREILFALIWILGFALIVDGMLFLMVLLTRIIMR
jgi:hypothetical protein